MIFADVNDNHNKWWQISLNDDMSCLTQWGRVGYGNSSQSKLFTEIGSRGFDRKIREKERKGYVKIDIVPDSGGTMIHTNNLQEVARRELVTNGDPVLSRLIDQLVASNIHAITSNTKITYNSSSCLFTTPLGIVTLDSIQSARIWLDMIANRLNGSGDLVNPVNQYLRLIPQNVGMRLNISELFPDIDAVQKQSDILDSLEASYTAVTTMPVSNISDFAPVEKIFDVDIKVINGTSEASKAVDWFESTKKRQHGYDNIHVINVFSIRINDMIKNFRKDLLPVKQVSHGTNEANLLSVLKSGLKINPPSTARKAGSMMGNGCYGAINSTKSLGYSLGRWNQGGVGNSAWLFLADFALGKIYKTKRSEPNGPPSGYDSLWAEAGFQLLNDEIVVYKENQVNLTILLECK